MTKFSDQLFDDLMQEHGQALAGVGVPAARRRHVPRPVMLTAGVGGLAAVAAVGTLVASGGTPAYAVTTNSDGTVTLALYQKSGIPGANAKLNQVGDGRVVVVPVEPGCPSISSLPAPKGVDLHATRQSGSIEQGGKVTTQGGQGVKDSGPVTRQDGKPPVLVPGKAAVSVIKQKDGSVSVNAPSVPAGDVLVIAYTTTNGSGMAEGAARLTTGPVPSCVTLPPVPANLGHVARAGVPGRPATVSPGSGAQSGNG